MADARDSFGYIFFKQFSQFYNISCFSDRPGMRRDELNFGFHPAQRAVTRSPGGERLNFGHTFLNARWSFVCSECLTNSWVGSHQADHVVSLLVQSKRSTEFSSAFNISCDQGEARKKDRKSVV